MGETGYNWDDAWSFVQMEAGDWDSDDSQDDEIQIASTAISLDGYAACVVGINITEPDGHAPAANSVTIGILGDTGDAYENTLALAAAGYGNPMQFKVTPIVSDSVYVVFSVDPRDYSAFKPTIMNESGVNLDFTVQFKRATIPVAS